MKHLIDLLQKYNLDYKELLDFTPIKNPPHNDLVLIAEEEFYQIIHWYKNYDLGFQLIPLLTDHESNYIAIFADGPIKGMIALIRHDHIDFAPKFKSLSSFLENVSANKINANWVDFNKNNFDFPSKEYTQADLLANRETRAKCWEYLNSKTISKETYELLANTIMSLTPKEELDDILRFLDDEHINVRTKCIELLGIFHKYEPTKKKIHTILKQSKQKWLLNKVYDGIFKKKGFWEKLFD